MTRLKYASSLVALGIIATGISTIPASPSGAAITATATRLVLAPGGAEPNGEIYEASTSADRRFTVFTSSATNLVAGDDNGVTDIFVKDQQAGTVSRVSLTPGGGDADADSYEPSISDNGRFVTFTTDSDLFDEENDFNFEPDVYLVDRDADTDGTFDEWAQEGAVRVARMSVGPEGVEADFGGRSGVISGDGRWVAFTSDDPLTEDDTNAVTDVYVRSTAAADDITRLISKGSTAQGGGGDLPSISQTGRFVTFGTTATDLVAGAPQPGLLLHDRDTDANGTFDQSGAIGREHLNKSTAGTVSSGSFDPAARASISPTGSCVAFKFINGAGLTADAAPNAAYLRNRTANTTVLASKTKAGLSATEVANPTVSPNCRYVGFDSSDSALAPDDGSVARDVYVKDIQTGDLERVSIDSAGEGATGPSDNAQTYDDTAALIVSSAPQVANATGGNGARDAFLVDFETAVAPATCQAGVPTVASATRSSVTVNVIKCPTSAPAPTGYRILAFDRTSGTPIAQVDVAANAATATITGLPAGQLVRFRALSTTSGGTGPQSGLSAFALPPFRTLDAFTDRQYRDFAGRAPTASELSTWRTQLTNGTVSPVQAVANANEFANWGPTQAPITRLFRAYFLRTPDIGGLNFWSNRRRGGQKLDVASQSFASSSEFERRYGTLSNRAYVELVFQNVLGRPGDAGGINFWTSQLDRRVRNRGQVMTGFSESNEYKRKSQAIVDSVNLFTGTLRRTPSAGELATWAPTTGTVPPLAEQIAFLLGSEAYDNRIP